MSKLIEDLRKNILTLIVSLPENSTELAKAAIEGGADALKVHINITHKAAGTRFGGLSEERSALMDILEMADIPVGIVPGEKILPSEKEMKEIARMGFDFFDINKKYYLPWMGSAGGLGKVLAVEKDFLMDDLLSLNSMGADGVEAAIVPSSEYGRELNVGDLQRYISIAVSAGAPVIVPTQRAIKTSEVAIIADTGAKGLMIGAIVTGKTPASIKKATQAFRIAIDDLG